MSHSKEKGPSGDFRWMFILSLLGGVGGTVVADMVVRRNPDLLSWVIVGGMVLTVLGIGYAMRIENSVRYLLVVLGGAGIGLFLRGYLAM